MFTHTSTCWSSWRPGRSSCLLMYSYIDMVILVSRIVYNYNQSFILFWLIIKTRTTQHCLPRVEVDLPVTTDRSTTNRGRLTTSRSATSRGRSAGDHRQIWLEPRQICWWPPTDLPRVEADLPVTRSATSRGRSAGYHRQICHESRQICRWPPTDLARVVVTLCRSIENIQIDTGDFL